MSRRVIFNTFKRLIESNTLPINIDIGKRYNIRRFLTCSQQYCGGREVDDSTSSAHGGKFELTITEVIKKWTHAFREHEISEPEDSIRNIIAYILDTKKLSDVDRSKHRCFSAKEIKNLEILCKRRLERMPIQYVIGEWEFRDLNLKMRPPAFIPRPETEMLVDLAIEEIRLKKAKKVFELCCGSGAISLALLKEFPHLEVTAVDKSTDACSLTKENARRLGLETHLSVHQYEMNGDDRMDFLGGTFDVIVSNPPYVPSTAMNELQQEIKLYEDLSALDGGLDGLEIIRHILKLSSDVLRSGSKLFLEVDPSHPTLLKTILSRKSYPNLCYARSHKDFCGKDRFVEIIKNE